VPTVRLSRASGWVQETLLVGPALERQRPAQTNENRALTTESRRRRGRRIQSRREWAAEPAEHDSPQLFRVMADSMLYSLELAVPKSYLEDPTIRILLELSGNHPPVGDEDCRW